MGRTLGTRRTRSLYGRSRRLAICARWRWSARSSRWDGRQLQRQATRRTGSIGPAEAEWRENSDSKRYAMIIHDRDTPRATEPAVEKLSLEKAATHLLEECRMVLPGIQALFGFQFVAVFNNAFAERLSPGEQRLHLVALLLVAVAAALVLAPAALHRQTEPRAVSQRFLAVSSRLVMWSMAPLAVGTSLDVYLVARVISGERTVAATCGGGVLLTFVVLWVVLPRKERRAGPAERAARTPSQPT